MSPLNNRYSTLDASDSNFDSAIAVDLLPLAQLAMTSDDLANVFLPPGWNKLAIVNCAPQPYQYPGVKGFLASGRVGDDTSTSVVLALGIDWSDWMQYYLNGPIQGTLASPWASAPSGSLISFTYNAMYNAVRHSLWDSLKFLSGMKLRVTGVSLSGPLAQMAALDLRAGNQGPNQQNAPGDVESYAFSTGAIANSTFATYLKSKVPNSYSVVAGTEANKIDFFPLDGSGELDSELGELIELASPLPEFDVPWVERSADFYIKAMDGAPTPPPTQSGTVEQASGFSRQLAFQFANLCAVSYQRFQHPNAQTMNISPYSVGKSITASSVNFATIYTSVDSLTVAFRGACTWQEFADYVSNSQTKTVSIDGTNVSVHSGAANLLYGPSDANASTTFKEMLFKEIQAALGDRTNIYFTGHDLGGAVANLAALDFETSNSLSVTSVYTFGATPTGGPDLKNVMANTFNKSCFQVNRSTDPFAKLSTLLIGYASLNTQVSVTGTPANDCYPYHSIKSYSNLLDPKE
ncbi:lipase family protein [Marinomonas primoryensis]|uniref:Fungal lipase-type domain-containing protein n=1 Tax=Marinomonas primoryensis TaxID=178399 RepID=A0ABV0L2D8_9GAMM